MEREWLYVINPFKSEFCSLFVHFAPIFRFSVSAFKDAKDLDPKYLAAYNLLSPMLLTYEEKYALWLAASGPAESSVEAFSELLRQESSHIHLWNQGVEKYFLNTTIEWKTMFPDKFSGFYSPTTEEGKVLEVQAFVNRTNAFVEVIETTSKAQDYHDQLNKALTLKSDNAKALTTASINLREYQDTVADELYGVLGEMIKLHRYTPLKTNNFFDLEEIRTKKPADHIVLKVNEYQYFVAKHQMINLPINFTKTSVIKGRVYFGKGLKLFTDAVITPTIDKVPNSAVNYDEKEIKESKVAELGSINNHYLMLYNSSDEDGMIVITVKKK